MKVESLLNRGQVDQASVRRCRRYHEAEGKIEPLRLRHVDQNDIAGPQRHFAPAGAEPHLTFDTEADPKMIHRAAGDLCEGSQAICNARA
jgi:hypothetical protein